MPKETPSSAAPASSSATRPSDATAPPTSEPFTLESLGRLMQENNAQLGQLKASFEERLTRQDTALTQMETRLAALELRAADPPSAPAAGGVASSSVVDVPHLRDHAPLPVNAPYPTGRSSLPSLSYMTSARQDGRHLQDRSRDRANSGSTVRFADTAAQSASASPNDGRSLQSGPRLDDAFVPTVPDDKFVLCKPDTLGEFHGDPFALEFFVQQVEDRARALQGGNWAKAVRAAIPEALRGTAREWHFSLTRVQVAELNTVDKYLDALRAAFPVDRVQLRRDAHDRIWKPSEETASAYTFPKVRMLRQAYGESVPEQLLVDETLAGLEPSMRALVRLPRDAQTVAALREELTLSERTWRDLHKITIDGSRRGEQSSPSPPTFAATPTATRPSSTATSRVAMTASTGPPASSGRGRYDPSRVVEAKGTEPRMYRRENGSYMRLGRPCGRCGEQHFDFEHAYLKEGARAFPMVPDSDDDYEIVDSVVTPASDF